jgi:hypothetical protein
MKIFDTLIGKEVEKTPKQFEVAKKLYPNRFTLEKVKKEPLPKTIKEEAKEEIKD